jgi:hypothetical protein
MEMKGLLMLRARGGAAEDQDRLESVVISSFFIIRDGVRALCGSDTNNRQANAASSGILSGFGAWYQDIGCGSGGCWACAR